MKRLILLFLLSFLLSSVCQAKQIEWTDPTYDFSTVKKIAIVYIYDSKVQDRFAQQKTEYLMDKLSTTKFNTNFVNFIDIIDRIKKENNLDQVVNEGIRNDMILYKLPRYVDAVMAIRVNELGWFQKYTPPSSFTYTTRETSNFNMYSTNGNGGYYGSISTPVQNTISIPGGFSDYPVACADLTLYSTKTGKAIWDYAEYIDNDKGGFLGLKSLKPEDNLEKIFNRAADHFPIKKGT